MFRLKNSTWVEYACELKRGRMGQRVRMKEKTGTTVKIKKENKEGKKIKENKTRAERKEGKHIQTQWYLNDAHNVGG